MIRTFKNSQQLGMVLAIAFFIAVLACAYMLYALPSDLALTPGYEGVLTRVYLVVAFTFLIGSAAIYFALSTRREVIVYKTRATDSAEGEGQRTDEGQKGTISLEPVQALEAGQSNRDLYQQFLQVICDQLEAGQGAYYETRESDGFRKIRLRAGYALAVGEGSHVEYGFGEGFPGQAASEGRTFYIDDIPEGYIKIVSGLGMASPRYLLIVPVKKSSEVRGVIEMAFFKPVSEDQRTYVEEAARIITDKITTE
jgi:methyl-accepting chemotaxis protein